MKQLVQALCLCVQTLEILLATLLFWETSFGDPLSVQKNAGKDLSFTERSERPLTVSADGLSPLSLIESNDERLVKVFGHGKPPVLWGPQL